MTNKVNEALQQKLAEFKAKSGMNQTMLARGIGVSPASISMYLNNNYAEKGGKYETIEPKIEAFLEVQESKARRTRGGRHGRYLRSSGFGQDSGGQKLLRKESRRHPD
jgi:Uncharacterized ATPase, putative transposase